MQTFTENELKVLISLIKSAIRSAVADAGAAADTKVKVVSDRLDRLVDGSASEAIDTFNEIEAFLRGLTDSDSLTGLLQQLRAGLETQIANKVDKVEGLGLSTNDYTDADRATVETVADERKQFNIKGIIDIKYGNATESEASGWRVTDFMPLSRRYPIACYLFTDNAGYGGIAFYDASKKFLSFVHTPSHEETAIAISDFPPTAVYFRANTIASANAWYSNGPTREARECAVSEAIISSKELAFIDQWKAAWGVYGSYDNNAAGGRPYLGNDLRMTYAEAVEVMRWYNPSGVQDFQGAYYFAKAKTFVYTDSAYIQPSCNCILRNNQYVEVFASGIQASSWDAAFNGCSNLRRISITAAYATSAYALNTAFKACTALEELRIMSLKVNISLADSPLINADSLSNIVVSALPDDNGITITVHPDVYAKLTDEGNVEWHAILEAAIAKNITFATTE